MLLSDRDTQLLTLIYKFKMLSRKQLIELLFFNLSSQTPLDRALKRLTTTRLVDRIEKPGGSGYVYILGSAGKAMFGDYKLPHWSKWRHTLAIADFYCMMHRLERAGYLRITDYSTEPECHVDVDGDGKTFYVRPDLWIEWVGSDGNPVRRFIEIDMGSQHKSDIYWKLDNYCGAYHAADSEDWPEEQTVLFVTANALRVNTLRRWLARVEEDMRGLFKVQTISSLEVGLKRAGLYTGIGRIVLL